MFPLSCVLCHPRSPGRTLQAAACASLESSVPRCSATRCQRTPLARSSRTGPCYRSEAMELWVNFFRHACVLNFARHRFRTDSGQKLSCRHSWTAFSHGISRSTPPCVRFGVHEKTFSYGHAYLAVRPTTNPASTCRDVFVSAAYLSLNGEHSGMVIGDPEKSSGLLRSPL